MTNMMNVKYFRSLVEQVQRAENLSEDLDRALATSISVLQSAFPSVIYS